MPRPTSTRIARAVVASVFLTSGGLVGADLHHACVAQALLGAQGVPHAGPPGFGDRAAGPQPRHAPAHGRPDDGEGAPTQCHCIGACEGSSPVSAPPAGARDTGEPVVVSFLQISRARTLVATDPSAHLIPPANAPPVRA